MAAHEGITVGALLDSYADQDDAERLRRYEELAAIVKNAEESVAWRMGTPEATSDMLRRLAWAYDVRSLMEKTEEGIKAGHAYPGLGF